MVIVFLHDCVVLLTMNIFSFNKSLMLFSLIFFGSTAIDVPSHVHTTPPAILQFIRTYSLHRRFVATLNTVTGVRLSHGKDDFHGCLMLGGMQIYMN